MIRENAKNLLQDVHSVLSSLGKKHFIIDGTLLGAIRSGDFIDHDEDIDFGVFFEEWTPTEVFRLTHELIKKDIMIKYQFGDFDNHFELSYIRNGIKADIFFYRRDGEHRIFHAFKNGGREMPEDVITYEYKAELIENLKPVFFVDGEYPAPADPVAVLEAKYGADWRTPNKRWDWAYGPKNIRS